MFDFAWSEMAIVAVIALIVIGPKELPQVLRTVRGWIGAARGMAREFQGHVDDMMRDSGIDEVRKSIRDNTALHLDDLADQVDPDRKVRDSLDPNVLLGDDPDLAKPAGAKSAEATSGSGTSGGEFVPPDEQQAAAREPGPGEPTLADVAPPPTYDSLPAPAERKASG